MRSHRARIGLTRSINSYGTYSILYDYWSVKEEVAPLRPPQVGFGG